METELYHLRFLFCLTGIDDGQAGLILETSLPENLMLTVSRDKYKDEVLLKHIMLINCDRYKGLK